MTTPRILPLGFIDRTTQDGAIIMLTKPGDSHTLRPDTPVTLRRRSISTPPATARARGVSPWDSSRRLQNQTLARRRFSSKDCPARFLAAKGLCRSLRRRNCFSSSLWPLRGTPTCRTPPVLPVPVQQPLGPIESRAAFWFTFRPRHPGDRFDPYPFG